MFFTDLDRTIIFSKRFVNDKNRDSLILVEEKEGRSISFMNSTAFQLLKKIRKNRSFVPVTARKYEEIMRISFIREDVPEWMICESGRAIYHRGKRLTEWDTMLEKNLNVMQDSIKEAHSKFNDLFKQKYKTRTWHINQEMVMGKTEGLSQEQLVELESSTDWFEKKGCLLHIQQRKVYLIPRPISKANAIAFLIQKLKPVCTISAGDADMDAGMFEKTTYAFAPRHHTIQTMPSHVGISKGNGVDAGEHILSAVIETFE